MNVVGVKGLAGTEHEVNKNRSKTIPSDKAFLTFSLLQRVAYTM